MPTPEIGVPYEISILADSNGNVYLIYGDIYMSADSSRTWKKIYSYETYGFSDGHGFWDGKLTIRKNNNIIYQYDPESEVWIEPTLPETTISYCKISETPKYNILLLSDKLWFQDKISSEWDSLALSYQFDQKGVIVGDEYLKFNNKNLEVYNLVTGESSVRYTAEYNSYILFAGSDILVTGLFDGYTIWKILISSDSGYSWQETPLVGGSLLEVDVHNSVYRIEDNIIYYSTDLCESWKPFNMAYIEPSSSFSLKYNIKYAYADGIKRYTGASFNYDPGSNFVPLHIGNQYLYKIQSRFGRDRKTYFLSERIKSSTQINGEKFYSFGNDKLCSYSDSSKLYKIKDSNNVYTKFNFYLAEGGYFQVDYPSGEPFTFFVRDINETFFDASYYCKGYDLYYEGDEQACFYAENIGLLYTFARFGSHYSSRQLVEAYIFSDSLNDFTHYTHGEETKLENNSHILFPGGELTIEALFQHAYDGYSNYNQAYAFTDTVFIYYALTNGQDTTKFNTEIITNLISDESVEFNYTLSDSILNAFSSFIYQFRTVDKNIIPDYRRFPESGHFSIDLHDITQLDDAENEIQIYAWTLSQNYPNPFNPETKISYSLKEAGNVELIVYDVLGNEVAKLVNEHKPAGSYEVSFNGVNLPSGVYIYRIKAGNFSHSRKMILLK